MDRSKCLGVGMCEATAPDLFEIDDEGVLQLLDPVPASEADAQLAHRAVESCPTQALSLVDVEDLAT